MLEQQRQLQTLLLLVASDPELAPGPGFAEALSAAWGVKPADDILMSVNIYVGHMECSGLHKSPGIPL